MAREDLVSEPVPETLDGVREYLGQLRADFDSHNHDGANSRKFQTIGAETFTARAFSVRKNSFTDTVSGIWMGLVGATVKFVIGGSNRYIQFNGSNIELSGDISARDDNGDIRLQIISTSASGATIAIQTAASTVRVSMSETSVLFHSSLTFLCDAKLGSHLIPSTTNARDLGESTTPLRWRTIYLVNTPDVSSDRRTKIAIKTISYGLAVIKKLRPVSFRRKKDSTKRTHLGFIAQEVAPHVPEAVSKGAGGEFGMSYEMLVPVLVKAVQELSAEVEQLKERVDYLQN